MCIVLVVCALMCLCVLVCVCASALETTAFRKDSFSTQSGQKLRMQPPDEDEGDRAAVTGPRLGCQYLASHVRSSGCEIAVGLN